MEGAGHRALESSKRQSAPAHHRGAFVWWDRLAGVEQGLVVRWVTACHDARWSAAKGEGLAPPVAPGPCSISRMMPLAVPSAESRGAL